MPASARSSSRLQPRWQADEISDELFFRAVKPLEDRIRQLRATKPSTLSPPSVDRPPPRHPSLRARWYKAEEEGGLPLSQKRAYLREALHAVIVHPAGGGRQAFDPDLLELIWRE